MALNIDRMSITAHSNFPCRNTSRRSASYGVAVVLAALFLMTFKSPALAESDAGLSRTVDGLTLYLGVMPSEIVGEHSPSHAEGRMHGGKRGERIQHVVVAAYDVKTNERVTDATVRASVRDPGINTEEKALQPMTIAGTLTYGNYFVINPGTRYLITIFVQRPGQHQPTKTQFHYARS